MCSIGSFGELQRSAPQPRGRRLQAISASYWKRWNWLFSRDMGLGPSLLSWVHFRWELFLAHHVTFDLPLANSPRVIWKSLWPAPTCERLFSTGLKHGLKLRLSLVTLRKAIMAVPFSSQVEWGLGREREISFWSGFGGGSRCDETSHQHGSVLRQALCSRVPWCSTRSCTTNAILSIWKAGSQIIQTVRAESTQRVPSSYAHSLNAVSQRNVPSRCASFSCSGQLRMNNGHRQVSKRMGPDPEHGALDSRCIPSPLLLVAWVLA